MSTVDGPAPGEPALPRGGLSGSRRPGESACPEAFADFYARHASAALARALLLCGHRQDAEDAVQEAFLEAYRAWHRVGGYESPEGWVDRVMRQRLARRRARWWARWRPVEVELPQPPGTSPQETAEAVAVLRALGMLPARQRQVVVLHCLYGLSYREVAETATMSVGAVGSTLAKAREKLASWLDPAPAGGTVGDRLVADGRAVADPIAARLRQVQHWLARGLHADARTVDRLRAGILGARGEPPCRTQ